MTETLRLLTPDEFRRRRRQIPLGLYLVATLVLAAGFIASQPLNQVSTWGATVVLNIATAASAVITAAATFIWGGRCGFLVYDRQGSFSFTHLLRNGVMTAIMLVVVCFIASPVIAVGLALVR